MNTMHPGNFIRKTVLEPKNLTVTKVAQLIGMSRPHLSNFLNGKVAATPEMAAQLERTFRVDAKVILNMQAEFDRQTTNTSQAKEKARTYVPTFLSIKANDITSWFTTNVVARTQLAVLLRILIHSTGIELQKVDFPGNDDAERDGKDGDLEANVGTPWIPAGHSVWEFGVNKDVKSKANKDFDKSFNAISVAERQNATFVFVTPRRWSGKTSWVKEKRSQKKWKDIRVYDVSDLEQWMEQSIPAQTWFANQTGMPSSGVRTLDRCWADWTSEKNGPLFHSLFATMNVTSTIEKIKDFLSFTEVISLSIAADSTDEALAFLSQLITTSEFDKYRSRVLVFDEPGILPKLANGTQDFIAVVHSQEVEEELVPYHNSLKNIRIYPQNVTCAPDIVLEPIKYDSFYNALKEDGFTNNEIQSLADSTGRSLTVLRRRFSGTQPSWTRDLRLSSILIPFAFLGTWNQKDENEVELLAQLANLPKDTLEKHFTTLLNLNDSPVWARGQYRGVKSKLDSLFCIANMVTESDLERFMQIAKKILNEDDPSVDLLGEELIFASISGKTRIYSEKVRENIADTIVLLAVHGKTLFHSRTSFDSEHEVFLLLRELLLPLTTRKLKIHQNELPLYAEASPDLFLGILEKDLQSETSQVRTLLKTETTPLFGFGCRTKLLHALEALAWHPKTFPSVVRILAKLATEELCDNKGNTPISSLESILCAWMPQTGASLDRRLDAIKWLLDNYPAVGWKVCVNIFGENSDSNTYTYKPKWRSDVDCFGEVLSNKKQIKIFTTKVKNHVLNMNHPYTLKMLCDLVLNLHRLLKKEQNRVWELIKSWIDAGAEDQEVATLRELIRITVLSHPQNNNKPMPYANFTRKGLKVYKTLQPKDSLNKHAWLFHSDWIEQSADEKIDENWDLTQHDRDIEAHRIKALNEIVNERGLEGVIELYKRSNCQLTIGRLLAQTVLDKKQIEDLVLRLFTQDTLHAGSQNLLPYLLGNLDKQTWLSLYKSLLTHKSEKEQLHFLLRSPYRASTWKLVDQLSDESKQRYWNDVIPQFILNAPDENIESVTHLLEAKRPRAAFDSIRFRLKEFEPILIEKTLMAMASKYLCQDKEGEYRPEKCDIKRAFQLITDSNDIPLKEKAVLEFAFVKELGNALPKNGVHQIPSLERYIEQHPEFFVQIIEWIFQRREKTENTVNSDKASGKSLAEHGRRILQILTHIPGQNLPRLEEQKKVLQDWVSTVRASFGATNLREVADRYLGQLFARAPIGKDGVWPTEPVRDIMEAIHSDDIKCGAHTGLYNARGVVWRKEGGDQERELANQYRSWAEALEFTHPFVASLLRWMVDTYESEATQQDIDAAIERRMVG